jgi:hypothetical protein
VSGNRDDFGSSDLTSRFSDMQGAPPFQASSIHTRRFYAPSVAGTTRPSSPGDTISGGGASTTVPGPATLPVVSPTSTALPLSSGKNAREQRLLSDLWLMSAATFRRMGKIEQCRGAIQEAEVADENNPAVWVQVRPIKSHVRLRTHRVYSLAWPVLCSLGQRPPSDRLHQQGALHRS